MVSEGIRAANLSEVFHEVKAAAGSVEKSAVKTLLETMGDVIVPLDSAFAISEDVPQFKGMLMLNPNASVDGVRLDNYIPYEDDKVRMQQQLTNSDPSSTDSVVRSFNVTMRDSDGNDIEVEMFGLAFETLNKSMRYMLGIRELPEVEVRASPLREPVGLEQQYGDLHSSQDEIHQAAAGNDANQTDASSSSTAASPRSTPPSSAFAHLRQLANLTETSEWAKIATTIALIGSWNFSAPHRSCCGMHAGLPEVKRILKRVRRMPCMPNLHVASTDQCSACGILEGYDNGTSCRVCKHKGRLQL
eukprot:TRINITY_DN47270_c0_g1_i1.p1 TRINITY_DN47270_c0_g1~~TRINITY_DN47270_c0_g1_i1.p1  ORF type:complete len:303 (-),score=31.86 TRINITY_DN47270_c0_g1_i1:109-1017(-)